MSNAKAQTYRSKGKHFDFCSVILHFHFWFLISTMYGLRNLCALVIAGLSNPAEAI